jgi:hypothetical protein
MEAEFSWWIEPSIFGLTYKFIVLRDEVIIYVFYNGESATSVMPSTCTCSHMCTSITLTAPQLYVFYHGDFHLLCTPQLYHNVYHYLHI